MTQRYRENKGRILRKEFEGRDLLPISETFNREAFDRLLAQPGCRGVRIYFSMDDAMQLRAIIVGVNERQEDILVSSSTLSTTESTELAATTVNGEVVTEAGEIIEEGQMCPPECIPPPPPPAASL